MFSKLKKLNCLNLLKNLMKFFFEILSNSFNTHNQIKYVINLKKNQMFKFEFIYNMSQNEFAIIRKYFEIAQRKQ